MHNMHGKSRRASARSPHGGGGTHLLTTQERGCAAFSDSEHMHWLANYPFSYSSDLVITSYNLSVLLKVSKILGVRQPGSWSVPCVMIGLKKDQGSSMCTKYLL